MQVPARASDSARSSALPLSSVSVIDFTFQAAGPYATMLLAALGAEVIKIESRVRPDPTRGRENRPYVHSVFFDDVNLGKKSVAINMKKPAGVAIARELIATADVVADNFRPGVMARLGLSPACLQQDHVRLVVASLSSAGADGPLAKLPGYAGIFNALGGLGGLTGYAGGPPTELRTSVDLRVGALFATAMVCGVLRARRSGTGSVIDFSAAEAVTTLIGDQIARYTLGGEVAARGQPDASRLLEVVVRCEDDRWLAVAVPDLETWRRLREELAARGIPAPGDLASYSALVERSADVAAALSDWLAAYGQGEAAGLLKALGAIVGPVLSAPDIASDEQHRHREFFRPVDTAGQGRSRMTAAPPWLLRGRPRIAAGAPELGENTREVLTGRLNRGTAEIDALIASGVLA